MNVIIFGATGMIGSGVLQECLEELAGLHACFFCLGVSAAGMSEKEYHRLTYEPTMAVAKTLVALNPKTTFCYVSGQGTDSSEILGRAMIRAAASGYTKSILDVPDINELSKAEGEIA